MRNEYYHPGIDEVIIASDNEIIKQGNGVKDYVRRCGRSPVLISTYLQFKSLLEIMREILNRKEGNTIILHHLWGKTINQEPSPPLYINIIHAHISLGGIPLQFTMFYRKSFLIRAAMASSTLSFTKIVIDYADLSTFTQLNLLNST